MTGLLAVGLLALWIWIAYKLSRWSGRVVARGLWQWPVAALVFAAFLPLPVLDEMLARPKIEALCSRNAVLRIDEARIKGRNLKYSAEPLDEVVKGVGLRTTFTRATLRDAMSGEELASRGSYVFRGGWLIRAFGISSSESPIFARSYCAPDEGLHEAGKRVGFTIIN